MSMQPVPGPEPDAQVEPAIKAIRRRSTATSEWVTHKDHPRSLAGQFYLSVTLNSVDSGLRAELRRIPAQSTELAPVFEAAFAVLLERCFTRVPDEATVDRFIDHMLTPLGESVRFDRGVARQLVLKGATHSEAPAELDRDDAIEVYGVFSYIIARRLGLSEDVVRQIARKAEQLAMSRGYRLTMIEP